MSVGRLRWTWRSRSRTACWSWDARPTSASPEPRQGWGHCARIPDPCTTATRAADTLRERAEKAGIPEVCDLYPFHDDFNTDLLRLGPDGLAGHIAVQLVPEDSRWLMRPWPEGIVQVA